MKNNYHLIENILEELQKKNILRSIQKIHQFQDDPKFHFFTSYLKVPKKYTDGIFYIADAHGLSFSSKKQALFTCLA